MSKCTVVKAVAALLFVLVFACAPRAHAGEVVNGDSFSSGTSFEAQPEGSFDYRLTDDAEPSGYFFWSGSVTDETASVVLYKSGEAYDYAAHTNCEGRVLERVPYLATNGTEKTVTKYLSLNPEQTLERSVFSRLTQNEAFSNVTVKTDSRDSIYCDTLIKFTLVESDPTFDPTMRLSIWVQADDSGVGETTTTNLVVSCGAFTNGFQHVSPFCCYLDQEVDLKRWYRLTVRAHGDVSANNAGIGGFSIYLDGQPVRARAAEYDGKVIDGVKARSSWLSPEARALLAERRLFFSYADSGSDKAQQISCFSFSGDGLVDDISFSSDDPGYGKPQTVFTLKWDSGLSQLKYTLDGGLTTNEAPITTARSADIAIGSTPTNGLKLVITDYAYDTAGGYKPGVWTGENGVTLTNNVEFVYDGTNRNPIAIVASSRDCVTLGEGGSYTVFKSALKALDNSTNALKTLVLSSDVTVSREADAAGNNDYGSVLANSATGEYVLDLNGYTLKGNPKSRRATLQIGCKSFRIIDSSAEKTGRIQPSGTYLDTSEAMNTSIKVYPVAAAGGYIEPILTIEAGIMDGWVRNSGQVWKDQAWTGVVFVEGGSYISTNSSTFYLDNCVTNPTAQFVYRNGYWSCMTTDAYIWTGEGANNRWTNPDNWRTGVVPPAGKTALFPSRDPEDGPWPVDVGANTMTTTNLWLEGDIYLTGTNHFEDVKLTGDGLGRICGTGTILYEGVQPGKLTETLLAADWAGTVLVRAIKPDPKTTPLVLKNIETWGTAYSTVEFNGVRGYVRDTASRTMEYKLRLRDYVWTNATGTVTTNAAWQNDSGYTGSTLAFKNSLLGDGTFSSGANKVALYQLFKFAEVSLFTGKLDIKGKRVLIGNDVVSEKKAGLVVFATQAVVPLNCGWECTRARFGTALNMIGETNQVLITCTGAQPDVTCCTNTTLNGLGNIAWLAVTDAKPWAVYATGDRPSYVPVPTVSASFAAIPSQLFSMAAAASSSGVDSYSAAAYKAAASALAPAAVEAATKSAVVSISVGDETITVTVDKAYPELEYHLLYRASLSDEWEVVSDKGCVDGSTVTFERGKLGDSGFYCIEIASPDVGGKGSDE